MDLDLWDHSPQRWNPLESLVTAATNDLNSPCLRRLGKISRLMEFWLGLREGGNMPESSGLEFVSLWPPDFPQN